MQSLLARQELGGRSQGVHVPGGPCGLGDGTGSTRQPDHGPCEHPTFLQETPPIRSPSDPASPLQPAVQEGSSKVPSTPELPPQSLEEAGREKWLGQEKVLGPLPGPRAGVGGTDLTQRPRLTLRPGPGNEPEKAPGAAAAQHPQIPRPQSTGRLGRQEVSSAAHNHRTLLARERGEPEAAQPQREAAATPGPCFPALRLRSCRGGDVGAGPPAPASEQQTRSRHICPWPQGASQPPHWTRGAHPL